MPTPIRINLVRPGRRQRAARATCVIDGRRYSTEGPTPIYRVCTLLHLHGHAGAAFAVHDDVSPFGGPGTVCLCGRVRNWTGLNKGKSIFDRRAKPDATFTDIEQVLIAEAAGHVSPVVSDIAQKVPPRCGNAAQGIPAASGRFRYLKHDEAA
jgi:hypothetical protein